MSRSSPGEAGPGSTVRAADQRAIDDERSAGAADQTASDADQTASDADQTASDADQTASERDEADAASDQEASDLDQAIADRQRSATADTGSRDAYEASRLTRAASTISRLTTHGGRGATARARLATAASRDDTAAARDEAARRRDEREAAIDRSLATSGTAAAATIAQLRARLANARARAAADRARAARDRADAARERARLEAELLGAHLDDLTGALRREMGWLALQQEVDRARRGDGRFVLAFVDVDGLKLVNDRDGHAAGDRVLATLARALRAKLRSFDPVIRYGGDEFVCGLGGVDLEGAERRFETIDRALRRDVGTGITVGLAALGANETLDELVTRADAILLHRRKGSSG